MRGFNPILVTLVAVFMAMPDVRIAHGQEAARQSYSDAMDWYRAGAEAGDPKAQFYLGVAFEEGGQGILDLAAARGWFKKAAKSGHALARYKLAIMLQSGKGGSADLVEARRLYILAAEQGVVEAKYNLAVMFQDGTGGPANPVEAANLFESAARGGVDISFLHLAVLKTRGPSADLVEAMKWAFLAKRAKVDGVDGYISALAPLLSVEQDEKARSRAMDWK